MKKIILLLFLFFTILACYIIYKTSINNKVLVSSVGDDIANIKISSKKNYEYNNLFMNNEYHIEDIIDTIKYNKEITINDKLVSIHQVLKRTDILIISIGMNDIYYKLNEDTKEIYTYLNNLLNNYDELLREINKYDYQQVFVLGYYNITDKNNDLFTYINYKLKRLASNYKYTYIELNKEFYNNHEYLLNNAYFYPNNKGINKISELIVENLKKY